MPALINHHNDEEGLDRLTTLSFPQTFIELRSLDDVHLNELIEMETIDLYPVTDKPIDHERFRYQTLVLSAAAKALNREDSSSLATLRLVPEFEGRVRIKNAAGFRIVDKEALANGNVDSAELVSVYLVKSSEDRNSLVPIVIPHSNSEVGNEIRSDIRNTIHEWTGEYPENLIKPRTARFLESLRHWFAQHSEGVKSFLRNAALGVGIISLLTGMIVGGPKVYKAISETNYNSKIEYSRQIRSQIDSIASIPTSDLRMNVMNNKVSIGYYQRLLNSNNPVEVKLKNTESLGKLITLELQNSRLYIPEHFHDGKPCISNSVRFENRSAKQEYFSNVLTDAISKETNQTNRDALIKVYNDVVVSFKNNAER